MAEKEKITPKWLYRLEYKDSSCGLWYDGDGNWCFELGIGSIKGCKTKTLPMDYDERYKQDGRDWFSSCSQKEDLMHWYSLEDAKELISKGFVFTRYLATEYHEYEQQTVFIKETSLYREEIDIFELFKQPHAEWSEEDNEIIEALNSYVKNLDLFFESIKIGNADILAHEFREKVQSWLKSLRPQNRWKPTKEQMEALKEATDKQWDVDGDALWHLYQDLKELTD